MRLPSPGGGLPRRSTRGFDGRRGIVPDHRALPEIGLVCQVAPERRVVSEDGILDHWLPRSDRLKEPPKMRSKIVVIIPAIGLGFKHGLFAGNRVMLLMPLLDVNTPEAAGIGARVVA